MMVQAIGIGKEPGVNAQEPQARRDGQAQLLTGVWFSSRNLPILKHGSGWKKARRKFLPVTALELWHGRWQNIAEDVPPRAEFLVPMRMNEGPNLPFNPEIFLAQMGAGRTILDFAASAVVFSQGDPADAIYYIHRGKVKLTVVSKQGKEAIIAILTTGDFFGEGCLAGQIKRMATATALTGCTVARLEKAEMIRALHAEPVFSELFIRYLLSRNIRIEEDLVDQLFNSSEKRLARVLLLLAHFGKEDKPEPVVPKISQEMLAEIIGTTRARVNFFMNKFRKLGFVDYNGGLHVHSSLLNVVLHD